MSSIPIAYSVTALAANASYTGNWVRIFGPDDGDSGETSLLITHDKLRVVGECYSDVVSAVNGMIVQQSHDGSTVRQTDAFTAAAATAEQFSVQVFYKYVRVLYTNGAGAQTTFEISARLVEDA